MQNVKYVPMGFEVLSSAQLSGSISPSPPAGANVALLNAETGNVRWRDDGTAPTTTVGMLITKDGDPYEYWGNLSSIKFINAGGAASLNISYYRSSG